MRPRLLDLCCGAGGAAMGLYRAGFDVTGVDVVFQPRYPFAFIQADALTVDLDGYDAYWASPPCQVYSTTRTLHSNTYADMVATIRTRLEATGKPYIIENVQGAPLRSWVMLCGQMFGLKVFRHRLFESNCLLLVPPHPKHDGSTGSHRWPYTPINGYVQVTGNGGNFTLEGGRAAMGIDWMDKAELAEAIPPAYAELLGRQLMQYVDVGVPA